MAAREQFIICGLALVNGIFIYPSLKRAYTQWYSLKATPTHFVILFIIIHI
jgi:hypothetical protein